jgi:hypothetical protein
VRLPWLDFIFVCSVSICKKKRTTK